jgi:hypothetical protein
MATKSYLLIHLIFDTIVSHVEWVDVSTAFKMRLQETLTKFQQMHGSYIDQIIGPLIGLWSTYQTKTAASASNKVDKASKSLSSS